uniref:supervillin-like n=1 Tax=Monopterus albus TaxID=43700 RepID=UPI0009B43C24|nr:supervillin-like [Monopterus albus]
MDGIDTLQSSAPETKAERIARYKAERRRELAERYGNTEEFTSKYVRRDRKIGDTSEMMYSASKEKEKCEDKDNGSEQTYTRRALRNKAEPVEHTDDEPTQEKETTTHLKTDTVLSSKSEAASSIKMSSYFTLPESDDTEEPKADKKPVDSVKTTVTSKMSLFKDLEGTEDGSCGHRANNRVQHLLMSSDEEEASISLPKTNIVKAMEEKEATDEHSQEREYAASAINEKPSSLHRQDSGPRGIKGILKKNRSTSVESDHSESSTAECAPAQQSSITLSHPESEEGLQEESEENKEEAEEEIEEEAAGGGQQW